MCLSVCLPVCDNAKTTNRSLKKCYVGKTCLKEQVITFKKRYGSYFGYKKILTFWRHRPGVLSSCTGKNIKCKQKKNNFQT